MTVSKKLISLILAIALVVSTFAVVGTIQTAAAYQCATPEITAFESSDAGVTITWKHVPGAGRYRVYYYGSKGWTRMGDTTKNSFLDADVRWGGTYTYTVRCLNYAATEFTSDFNADGWKYTHYLDTPQITDLYRSGSGMHIEWDKVKNAAKYRVYYSGRYGWTKMVETTETEYQDDDVVFGYTYTYTVRCVNAAGTEFTSDFNSTGWSKTLYYTEPEIDYFVDTDEGVKIKIVMNDANYNRVYYKGRSGWVAMADTAESSYLDEDVRWGGTYTYTLRSLSDDRSRFVSNFNPIGWTHTHYLETPEITGFKSVGKGVEITWDAVKNAEKYAVYYKGRSGWVRMGTTDKTSFIDDDVNVGSTYYYTVRCLNKAGNEFTSSFNDKGWAYKYDPKLATPAFIDYECVEDGLELRWNAVEGADLYRLYYYGANGWTRMADVRGTSYVDEDVSYDSTYRYTIRCLASRSRAFASDFDEYGLYARYYQPVSITGFANKANGVEVTYSTVQGANYYYLFRLQPDGSWKRIGRAYSGDGVYTIMDKTAQKNTKYTYVVRGMYGNEPPEPNQFSFMSYGIPRDHTYVY